MLSAEQAKWLGGGAVSLSSEELMVSIIYYYEVMSTVMHACVCIVAFRWTQV